MTADLEQIKAALREVLAEIEEASYGIREEEGEGEGSGPVGHVLDHESEIVAQEVTVMLDRLRDIHGIHMDLFEYTFEVAKPSKGH